jgi:hypothetical protein
MSGFFGISKVFGLISERGKKFMLKDLKDRVVPHPTEYLVMVGNEITPITKRIAYNRVASFVHKSHALAFAKSITSFHTAVIDPDPKPNNELVISGYGFEPHHEGWDA